MKILKPLRLKKGALIGLISPASPQRDESRLERGIKYLESLGFRVKMGSNALARFGGYLAGTDAERIADIETMFADPQVDAIFCVRGGYGTPRIVQSLNYRVIARNPKIFVGFSDTTVLQSAIFRRTGLITFFGAMPSVDMADVFDAESESWFWKILTEPAENMAITQSLSLTTLHGGIAEGQLWCGNLSLLVGLAGTPFAPPYKGGILLMEDIGEAPYRIDRNLAHLQNTGLWNKLGGLCFGQFTQTESVAQPVPQRTVAEITAEYASRAGLPAIGNVMFGHTAKKLTLPFGIRVRLDADRAEMRLIESALI